MVRVHHAEVVMLQVPLLWGKMASSIKINYNIFFQYNETS